MSRDGSSGGDAGGRPRGTVTHSPEDPGLLERVPAILYCVEWGVDGAWRYTSPQIESVLGFTAEQWCGDPTLWRTRLHPEDAPRVLAGDAGAQRDGEGEGAIEYRILHRDGHVVWLRNEARLVSGADGSRQWHGVLSDVTDRRFAEARLERAAAQHAAVAALGEHALEGASAAELAEEAITAATELLGVDFGAVIELDAGRHSFTFLASRGMAPESLAPMAFDPGSQPGYAITHGGVVVSDWTQETRFRPSSPVGAGGARSGMSIVIEGRRRRFGVLGVHSTATRDFSRIDVDFAQTLANVLGDAFERQLTEDDIRHRALHDLLTGLPNRSLFMDRLGHALEHVRRQNSRAAILFVDVDRFKLVNESLGHEIGDELLAAAARRLKQIVRGSDTVARFGADEFAVLLEDIGGEHAAIEMAQRIASVFTRPFLLAGEEHFVTTSIGISLALGGERAEDLVRDAEAAMHRAKERGRARYELFDEGIRVRAISRLRVENDLRRALDRDELTLDYQPIVTLPEHSIVSVEALVRWEHPTRGRVPPLEFIPIAEENGLIEPIGRWVLEHACHQAAEWYRQRPDAAPISIAVNLSALQFENPTLPDTVATALRAAGLDPALLGLEITESVMMGGDAERAGTLSALKETGARLILDDFGTGYSSLAYLSRLTLDVLKVDRSFVDGLGIDPSDTTITEAIIAMAHALSLDVVGEGAETERQVSELARLGCDLVQGFHFSRPVSAARIGEMLAAGPPWLARRP
jgi:diguanylate cyclase (GGDEF)-like protein/PAS domain S-box-containing protein